MNINREKRAYREFFDCVSDLLAHERVQAMEGIPQHAPGVSCLDHCLLVSYVSFLFCRRLSLDFRAAARGALLHDFYLCDWKEMNIGPIKKLRVHPRMALENADVFSLGALERDIIAKHMWPVTARPPRYRESFLVCAADKLCAVLEVLGFHPLLRPVRMLTRLKLGMAAA